MEPSLPRPLFPLAAGTKKPLRDCNWKEAATFDSDVIEGWRRAGKNLALPTGPPSGIVVRDYDGEEGLALARREWGEFRELFKCLVRTPNSGLHAYFRQPEFPVANAVKVNGKPVDHRGLGGFVGVVGNQIKGRFYEYVKGFEFESVQELPVFPAMFLPQPKEINHDVIEETDVLRRITRARLWLATVDPAVSGQNGHKTMFRACCKMFQMFDLSIAEAYTLILEYNDRCLPSFSEAEIRHKIESARAISQKGF